MVHSLVSQSRLLKGSSYMLLTYPFSQSSANVFTSIREILSNLIWKNQSVERNKQQSQSHAVELLKISQSRESIDHHDFDSRPHSDQSNTNVITSNRESCYNTTQMKDDYSKKMADIIITLEQSTSRKYLCCYCTKPHFTQEPKNRCNFCLVIIIHH